MTEGNKKGRPLRSSLSCFILKELLLFCFPCFRIVFKNKLCSALHSQTRLKGLYLFFQVVDRFVQLIYFAAENYRVNVKYILKLLFKVLFNIHRDVQKI